MKEDLYNKQIEYYRKIIALDPHELESWEKMGRIYENLGDYDKALVCLEIAANLAPYDIDILIKTGDIYTMKNDYNKSIEFYEKAINTAPDQAAKRKIPLIESYKRAIELNSDDINLWLNLGYAYELKKNYAGALECYEKALQINPNDAMARFKWHEAHENIKKKID
jgi:tetratricopeptide (TPR) repeat protein